MTYAVEMSNITKSFPGVVANNDVEFLLEKGEIHGLLGENGAGKSVLMKILYGLLHPDEGHIRVNGTEVAIKSPSTAIQLGIGMVHQHFMLVPSLTVTENIILGHEPTSRKIFLDLKRALRAVSAFCERYKLTVDLNAPAHTLPVGAQQRVEILKALYRGAEILILDEPTSVLTPQEVGELFTAIRALKEQGKTIVFISHKLSEVMEICNKITVLRKGRVVGILEAGETSQDELAVMMVGRKISFPSKKEEVKEKEIILSVQNLKALDDRGLLALKGVTLQVHTTEILGIAGVEGNGQTELVEVLAGLRNAMDGRIFLAKADITRVSPGERRNLGISHIPEDRQKRGLILDFTVMENLILGSHNKPPFSKGHFRINFRMVADYAKKLIGDFSISTPSKDTLVRYLSGGTQQRVVVAREFSREPRLIIASQPTRGLDVGATEYVHKKLVEMRDQGYAILLLSADLDEIWSLSDRISIMYEGKIVATRDPKETSQQELGVLMAGGKLH